MLKKRNILFYISGVLPGALIVLLIVLKTIPTKMLVENESKYNFNKTIEVFKATASECGWKVPHESDLQMTMAKFGNDVKAVQVYDLCHPDHSVKILRKSEERIVTLLMLCRVAIYEKDDGKIYVSTLSSGLLAGLMGGTVKEVMKDASEEIGGIIMHVIK
jgi:uncharacterized protein (DUF302 family)